MFKKWLISFILLHACLSADVSLILQELCLNYFKESSQDSIPIQKMSGGFSEAVNYQLNLPNKRYVLKTFAGESKASKREIQAMVEAGKSLVSPKVYYVGKDHDFILIDYVLGNTLTVQEAKQPCNITKLANTLRDIHSLPQNPYSRAQYKLRMEGLYEEVKELIADKTDITNAINIIRNCYQQLELMKYPLVTIHGDLNPRNIFLREDKALVIDWSETNWEDPFLDLANLSVFLDYTMEEDHLLLKNYLRREPSNEETKRYQLLKKVKFASCSLICNYLQHLVSGDTETINLEPSLKFWRYYTELFANNDQNLTGQYFYESAKVALMRARD